MDPTTAVRTDTLPAIATVVAPGAFASATYVWLLLAGVPSLRSFLNEHEAVALAAAVLLWIVMGFAIDSAGSYVEVYCIDRPRPDHQQMLDIWWRYLRIAWEREPIGQRYLRRLLVTFKFELNMFVAVLVSIPGVALLACIGLVRWPVAFGWVVLLGVSSVLLAAAARASADVLAEVRSRLVRGVGEPPFDELGNPSRRPRA